MLLDQNLVILFVLLQKFNIISLIFSGGFNGANMEYFSFEGYLNKEWWSAPQREFERVIDPWQ